MHTTSFYTEKLLHTASFHTQQAFTHTTLTHSAFTHGKRLHTQKSFYTQQAFTHKTFYTQQAFTEKQKYEKNAPAEWVYRIFEVLLNVAFKGYPSIILARITRGDFWFFCPNRNQQKEKER
jgi:hypothetical protein